MAVKDKQSSSTNGAKSTLLPASGGGAAAKAEDHPCFNCVLCCSYVATEIDAPTTNNDYDCVFWYLYHEGVSVFIDWDGDWYIQFESRCKQLTSEGLCGVYEDRPSICREYDFNLCEKAPSDEPVNKWQFNNAAEFEQWFAKQRPKAYRQWREHKQKQRGKKNPEVLHRLVLHKPAPVRAVK